MSDIAYSGTNEDATRVEPRVADFIQLLKPRVMSLVVFTGVVGLIAAPGSIHPVTAVIALIAIAVGAGASGAINMWYDADIDGVMRRTAGRGIPSGRVEPESALAFGLFLAGASVITMGLLVGYVAAGYLAFTIAFYAVIYTMWLKRWTPQNIVIGGAAGALPPVIGWVAVTGEAMPGLGAWALFALIFMWTPPHFWALALFRKDDYAMAKVPMLPVVAGERRTRREILLYSLLLAATSALPYAAGVAGEAYLALAVVGGGTFVALAFKTWREADGAYRQARRLFGFSILYLFVLFAAILVEQVGGRVG